MPTKSLVLSCVLLGGLALCSGCTVVSAVDAVGSTAIGVTKGTVKTTGKVAGGAARTTGRAAGAVLPGGKER
jgi:hypothetical protein